MTWFQNIKLKYHAQRPMDKKLSQCHERKFQSLLKEHRQKFAILSPDKGSGVVILKKYDYQLCMTGLFADKTKFTKLKSDPALTQLTTLQKYLRTIYNRGEITGGVYLEVQPQSTKPTRAHGLPKTHKDFDTLPPFRPIIDTTGTSYQPIGKYLTRVLNHLTMNAHTLTDSFEAVS